MAQSKKLRLLTAVQVVEEQQKGAIVLDTRPAQQFAAVHVRGAIQIGLAGPFSSWAAMLLKLSQKLVVVANDESTAEEAHVRLSRVGFEQVIGYSLADEDRWRDADLPLASIPTHRCGDVQRAVAADPYLQLVDVRSRAEWLRGHLPGAVSVPLLDFESSAQLIDRSTPSIVYCHAGFRASTAVSILLRESSNAIGIFLDGFEGWSALGLPLETPHTK